MCNFAIAIRTLSNNISHIKYSPRRQFTQGRYSDTKSILCTGCNHVDLKSLVFFMYVYISNTGASTIYHYHYLQWCYASTTQFVPSKRCNHVDLGTYLLLLLSFTETLYASVILKTEHCAHFLSLLNHVCTIIMCTIAMLRDALLTPQYFARPFRASCWHWN